MMDQAKIDTCPLCGGSKLPGETTISVELGFGVIVVRHVPALVCDQCGANWLEDTVSRRLEEQVEAARAERQEVKVVGYSACV